MRVEPTCQRCGCNRSAHYSEIQSTGDLEQPTRRVYYACLNLKCDCGRYLFSNPKK